MEKKEETWAEQQKKLGPPSAEPKVEEASNKRQSFISDFAALEKTYKILGISKGPDMSATEEGRQVRGIEAGRRHVPESSRCQGLRSEGSRRRRQEGEHSEEGDDL